MIYVHTPSLHGAKQPRLVLIFFCLCALGELPIWTPHMRPLPLQRLTFGIWAAMLWMLRILDIVMDGHN